MGYIEARKEIYVPLYAKYVAETLSYKRLDGLAKVQENLILLDYDVYDHQALDMTLRDVVNNPKRKCGHAFVLLAMLTNNLKEMLE